MDDDKKKKKEGNKHEKNDNQKSEEKRTATSCFTESQQMGSTTVTASSSLSSATPHHHHSGHDHDHDDDHGQVGVETTLYPYIDTTKLACDNEGEDGMCHRCFKPWHQRLDFSYYLESGVDEQLILHIPFTVAVKVKSICMIGGDGNAHPKKLKLFKNKYNIDFSNVDDVKCEQEIDLVPDSEGKLDYALKQVKWQNVNQLTIYVESNYGSEEEEDVKTRIYYIGIKGESTSYKKQIVKTVYEARPQLKDHKTRADTHMPSQIQ